MHRPRNSGDKQKEYGCKYKDHHGRFAAYHKPRERHRKEDTGKQIRQDKQGECNRRSQLRQRKQLRYNYKRPSADKDIQDQIRKRFAKNNAQRSVKMFADRYQRMEAVLLPGRSYSIPIPNISVCCITRIRIAGTRKLAKPFCVLNSVTDS